MSSHRGVSLVGGGDGATEGLRGLFCGVVFGLTSPLIGHPLDSIKSKMQAQPDYLHGSTFSNLSKILRNEGFLALYRGLLPPLLGSSIFRSVQFSAYGLAQGASRDSPELTTPIPFAGGMQWRVVTSGVFAASCRALIESPLEFIKVRRQTGQTWRVAPTIAESLRNPFREVASLYTGFSMTWARTAGLMTSFFMMVGHTSIGSSDRVCQCDPVGPGSPLGLPCCSPCPTGPCTTAAHSMALCVQVDHLERHHPDIVAVPLLGPFIKGGVCATIGWILVWPFENVRRGGAPVTTTTSGRAGVSRPVPVAVPLSVGVGVCTAPSRLHAPVSLARTQ
jgi:hypothetical protein